MHAARNLFGRAVALLADGDPRRAELLPAYAEVLMEVGEFSGARSNLSQAIDAAAAAGLSRVGVNARIVDMLVRLHSGDDANWSEEAERVARAAIEALPDDGAHEELANAYRLLALSEQNRGRLENAASAIVEVTRHARRAGNQRLVARSSLGLCMNLVFGPTPVPQALEQCESILDAGLGDRLVEAMIQCKVAQLRAMNGEFDAARALYRRGRDLLRDLGQGVRAASTGGDVIVVELLAGDLATAESEARADYRFLEQHGEAFFMASMAAWLARVVRDRGHDEEALALTRTAEAAASEDDWDAQVLWRAVRAPIIARAGDHAGAEALATIALESARRTEDAMLLADTLFELAVVEQISGRLDRAKATVDEACSLYAAKGNRAALARAGAWAKLALGQ
jgi:tetratricopeptide (TPR) repeat protein